ncbi:MAG: glutamine synthetase III [Bacteroidota bacterium]
MNPRIQAIQEIRQRQLPTPLERKDRASQWFGEQVFSGKSMKQYLPEPTIRQLQKVVRERTILPVELAGPIASAVKSWAMDKGATHFTHWLQPLSGIVAEKHNTFLELTEGEAIDAFSGEELLEQSPDASSFPEASGRTTFEARGAMAWDCQSPMFIFETTYGRTLVIPTLFVSYTGETLDFRIPLLRSQKALEEAVLPICEFFRSDIQQVIPTLGQEQEYYLVDRCLADLRPDLILTGRTVLGAPFRYPPLWTEQYFSAIPERVYAFMNELEQEAHRMGIPLKTRHNESSPGQFECASRYEPVSLALDHGLMVMDLIQRVARKHHFTALLHEKPFAQFNGSAKHNNWSMQSGAGLNLLAPGTTPEENLMFLIFFVSMIKGLHQYAPLLAAHLASAGNDLRLGSKEAPPPVMSIFIGEHLSKVLKAIETPPRRKKNENLSELELLGIAEIPPILVDNKDRNRTSPIAFTGNKFEFRTVGASANCSDLISLVQLILAEQLREFHFRVQGKVNRSRKLEAAIIDILREYVTDSKAFRYEGDSNAASWRTQAKERKLFFLGSTPEAVQALTSSAAVALYDRYQLFSAEELANRKAETLRQYVTKIRAESELLIEICQSTILPLSLRYFLSITEAADWLPKRHQTWKTLLQELEKELDHLLEKREVVEGKATIDAKAKGYAEEIRPMMEQLREVAAQLEQLLPDDQWPLPKYRELLFLK